MPPASFTSQPSSAFSIATMSLFTSFMAIRRSVRRTTQLSSAPSPTSIWSVGTLWFSESIHRSSGVVAASSKDSTTRE